MGHTQILTDQPSTTFIFLLLLALNDRALARRPLAFAATDSGTLRVHVSPIPLTRLAGAAVSW